MAVATFLAHARNRCTALCLLSRLGESAGQPRSVIVPDLERPIEIKLASTEAEWEEALAIVADSYRWRGYERPGINTLRFTPYHALPDTAVLVAKHAGRVVATFSLVADNHVLGLPLEQLYRDEVCQLRAAGRRIFETICLADRDLSTREFLHVFLAMVRLAWQYGTSRGGNTNVITVNPRHRNLYTKLLGYAPLGPVRAYEQVEGHPAEAYVIDQEQMRRKAPRMHQAIFGGRIPPGTLNGRAMPAELMRQFARRSTQCDPASLEALLQHVRRFGNPRRWGQSSPSGLDPVGVSSILATLAMRRLS